MRMWRINQNWNSRGDRIKVSKVSATWLAKLMVNDKKKNCEG